MDRNSDEPTIYHGNSIGITWADLDPLDQYEIIEITPDNTEYFGLQPEDVGLKIRFRRTFIDSATSLADARAKIAAHLARTLVMIEGHIGDTYCWEPAIPTPEATYGRA